jgi:hypothetical protein
LPSIRNSTLDTDAVGLAIATQWIRCGSAFFASSVEVTVSGVLSTAATAEEAATIATAPIALTLIDIAPRL